MRFDIREYIFVCLFSVLDIISLSRHEQVCLIRLRFERYFSHHRAISHRQHQFQYQLVLYIHVVKQFCTTLAWRLLSTFVANILFSYL